MGQKTGSSTGTVYSSPSRQKRQAKRRQAEEKRWAAKSGPVEVRRVGDPPVGDTPSELPEDVRPSA